MDLSNSFMLPDEPGLYRAEWTLTSRGEVEPATKIETVVVNRFRPLVEAIRELLHGSKRSARDLAARGIEREILDAVLDHEVEDEQTLLTIAGMLGQPAPAAETEAAAPPPQVARDASASPPLREHMPVTAPPPPVSPPTEIQVLSVPGVLSPSLPGEPAQAELTMFVEVDTDEVMLRFGDRIYRSRLHLDAERLAAVASPREYGETLFDALFNPDGLDGFDSSTLAGYNWASAQPGGGRRIEIELRSLELQERKWEHLADSRDRSELPLAAVQSQPFYRRWGNAQSALTVARPLRILAAVASPATLGRELDDKGKKVNPRIAALSPIDVAQERDVLETGLQRLAGFAEYHVLESPVTLKALREALQDGYHVLHLLAHGLLVEGSHYLVLEGDEPPHHLVPAETFCNTLQGSSLRLVVLAACQSAVPEAARSLRGLGASLLDAVPAVIAMQDEVRIDTAQLFTQHFYDRLARTGRVDQAMARTRAALYQEGGGKQWQWGVPVLLMSTGDGRLFDVDEARIARELPRLEPQVKSYQELAGAGDPTSGKWERAFGAAARAYDLPLTVLPAPAAVPFAAPVAPPVEPETLARPQDRAELLALARIDLDTDELSQEVAAECRLDLQPGVYAQIASALNAGKHVILIGPPGTGKTSLAHAVCNFARKKGFATGAALTTATADWTAFDTVGGYVPTLQQTLQFRAGVFLEAIRTGRWLVIDEINRAEIDKAFGELFTVLAGQQVDLPYSVGPYRVRVLPPAGSDPESWLPAGLLSGYDYVIHPNWRIVATMNVYDKSHLFTLSFAFMRRFAFVDVELPGEKTYGKLIDGWLAASGMPPEQADPVREVLGELLTPGNPLTSCRELGPAIVKDMIAYMSHRHSDKLPPLELLAEALLLYVTPQLDGIDSERIVAVRRFLAGLVGGDKAGEGLLRRVRSLYPHVPPEAWT
jgi:MoxR-like ATPase